MRGTAMRGYLGERAPGWSRVSLSAPALQLDRTISARRSSLVKFIYPQSFGGLNRDKLLDIHVMDCIPCGRESAMIACEEFVRPEDLPDFTNPPLNEVVFGVQFNPAQGYTQIRAGEVWSLFKGNFPLVEEQAPLHPQFETFGLPTPNLVNFEMVTGGQHDRFWFLSKDKHELIQFQEDRLLHNWRQVEGQSRKPYPRFESILEKFEKELAKLQSYFDTLATQKLIFTQAEITYINHIELDEHGPGSNHSAWLNFLNWSKDVDPDDMGFVMRRALYSNDAPFARLIIDAKTGFTLKKKKIIVLTITVRGNPPSGTLADVVEFLKLGREVIVHEFAALTTEYAHSIWNRVS